MLSLYDVFPISDKINQKYCYHLLESKIGQENQTQAFMKTKIHKDDFM